MRRVRQLTGAGEGGLDLLTRHLWLPLVESGHGRVVLTRAPGEATLPAADGRHRADGWHDVQSFTVLPTSSRPRLLVSRASRPATVRALLSHRGLRAPTARAGRVAAATAMALAPPRLPHTLTVQVRDPADAPRLDPVSGMAQVLEAPVLAVLGVRRGANGKATIQLFDRAGYPLGYAKVAWNALTAGYVRTEVEALRSTRPAASGVRLPRVLAEGTLDGHRPFLVTEPLPPTARRLSTGDLPVATLAGLFSCVRRDAPFRTGQVSAVVERMRQAHRQGLPDEELRSATADLSSLLEATTVQVPVWERWHGDLVPWNGARDQDGSTWLWDWESGDRDAVAGLDILHWTVNTLTAPGREAPRDEAGRLRAGLREATLRLQAAGLGPRERDVVAAVYALTVAERHWTLAASHGSWSRNRVGRGAVLEVVAVGRDLMVRPGHGERT